MSPDERAIRDCIERWHRATADGDVGSVLPLMADEVVFLTAGAPPLQGRPAFARAMRAALQRCTIRSTATVLEIAVADDLAYAWSDLSVVVTPRDGTVPVSRRGPALTIFRRVPGAGWVVSRDANLLAVASPS